MNFDQDYYFGKRYSNYSNYRIHRRKILWWPVLRILKKYKGGDFLDIGCAFGYLVNFAKPHFKRVAGVDISEFAIEEARRTFPNLEFYVADVAHLPFQNEEFDTITALDILEHTSDVGLSLKEVHRVLKKGGFTFLRMPHKGIWRKLLGCNDKDKTHISVLTEEEYKKLIKQSGFQIIQTRTYITPWGGNINFLLRKKT